MAKPKAHRANKANDSFGTINNDQIYKGKYREDVYKEDEEETTVEEQNPSETEATSEENTSFAKPKEESETDYKKRYDDLKRHYDSKIDEWKKERQEILDAQQAGRDSGLQTSELPKNPEELEEFKKKYPDVYAIVETVSSMQADSRLSSLKSEIEELKGKESDLKIQAAYKELLGAHPDFAELKTHEQFLGWLDQQPESISDGIYRNNTDARWAIRVVDLYKADVGIRKTRSKSKDADPAIAITRPSTKDVVGEATGDKKTWTASEIGKMKPWEFEKLESELDAARAEGRIDYAN